MDPEAAESRQLRFSSGTLGWLLFAALFAVALGVAVLSSGGAVTGEEAAARLASESFARDGDLVFSIEDESRMRLRGWPETIRPPMVIDPAGTVRFEGPWFHIALLAPLERAAGRYGPLVLNGLLLLVLAVVAASSLKARWGETAVWAVTALAFGSVVFGYLGSALPVLLIAAATGVGAALLSKGAVRAEETVADMYSEVSEERPPIVRFVVAGLLLGIVAAYHPVYCLLLLAPLALTRREAWGRALIGVGVGAVAMLALAWMGSGLWVDHPLIPTELERVEVSVGSGVTGVERSRVAETDEPPLATTVASPTLFGWNLAYAAVGRHIGLVPYFVPLLFVLAAWRPSAGRGALLALACIGLVLTTLTEPFDFAGLPAAIGNRVFVPFFVLLWWLPGRPVSRGASIGALLLGTAFLWPLWLSGSGALSRVEEGDFPTGPLLEILPVETTQRQLPVRGEVVTRDLLVRPQAGLQPAGRRGHFVLPKGRTGELLLVSPGSLGSLRIKFDAAAASSIDLSGGTARTMTLMPDGGVAFDVDLESSPIRHPVWWSAEEHTFHRLKLAMPDAKGATVFSFDSGR